MKLFLALATCGLASGFVARTGLVRAPTSSCSTSRAAPGAGQGLTMMTTPYERAQRSIFDTDESLAHIFARNKQWAQALDPAVLARLAKAQAPKILYIGCSDSRVPAENMMGLQPGDLFVHRNVANLCIGNDLSMLSVLKYAVEVLEVTDIIVCGHYGCGGVKASTLNVDHGLLETWLCNIRNVQRIHHRELAAITDEDLRFQRLVELNVQEACMNLFANPIVQKKQAQDVQPRIHGWVYDIASGLLKDVKIDFKAEVRKYKDIYSLYDFPSDGVGANTPAMTPRKTETKAASTSTSQTEVEPAQETVVYAPAAPQYAPAQSVNGSSDSAEKTQERYVVF